jgi:hypothetical protein
VLQTITNQNFSSAPVISFWNAPSSLPVSVICRAMCSSRGDVSVKEIESLKQLWQNKRLMFHLTSQIPTWLNIEKRNLPVTSLKSGIMAKLDLRS